MKIEFEATFIEVSFDQFRKRLANSGAKLVKDEFLQTRVIINPPLAVKNKNSWLRLRDEADRITLTYKVITGYKIEDQKEVCLEVDDFAKTLELLQLLGCEVKAYQESKREMWLLDGVEICLDQWPYLPPFVEIEGQSEAAVKAVAEKVGFDYTTALFGNVGNLYQKKYGIEPDLIHEKISRLTFTDPNPFIKK